MGPKDNKKDDEDEKTLDFLMSMNLDKTKPPKKTLSRPENKTSHPTKTSSHKNDSSKVIGRESSTSKYSSVRDGKGESKYVSARATLVSKYSDPNSAKVPSKYADVGLSMLQYHHATSGSSKSTSQYPALKLASPFATPMTHYSASKLTGSASPYITLKPPHSSASAIQLQRDHNTGSLSKPPNIPAAKRSVQAPSKSTTHAGSRAPEFAKSVLKTAKDIEFATRQTRIDQLAPTERKAQDKWAQSQLAELGTCPHNWNWIEIKGGYICAGEAHGVTHEDIAEGKRAIRFLEQKTTRHGGPRKYYVGPYYLDESFGERGIWKFGGDRSQSKVSAPDAYLPVLVSLEHPAITWPVCAGRVCVDALASALPSRTPSLEEFENLRPQLEREWQANLLIPKQMQDVHEKASKNKNGSGKPAEFL